MVDPEKEDKNSAWVLIIDDDAGLRESTADILEARGYHVLQAASGLDGLELVSKRDRVWAAALVDLVLPDIEGGQVIERLQEISPLTQVIIFTGFASVDSVVSGLRANVIDYLQKPVDPDYLIATIDGALERRERLIAEEKVRQAANEWRITFDTIPDAIMIIDADSKIARVNRAARDLFGLSYQEIIGRPCFSLVHPEIGLAPDCPHQKALADGGIHSLEIYLERLRRHFLITCSPINLETSQRTGSVHVMRDVTEQKEMQVKMLQAEKLAAVGQLAAGVAHEVNNPLSFIMTNLGQLVTYVDGYKKVIRELIELAERKGKGEAAEQITELTERHDLQYIDSDVSELLAETLNGLVRIRNIVADLRKLSYMSDEDAEEVDLNRLVSSVANIARNEVSLRGELKLELGEIPTVHGVPGRLYQAILNILINASQSLDEARRDRNQVTLTTGQRGNEVFARISDTGAGIAPEIIDHIFDPFFTTKRAGEGSGLGLAICHDIAHQHHGRIEAQSRPGQGSVFTLWLPLDARSVLSSLPDSHPPPSVSAPKQRILIVDDEPEVLKSLNRVLGRAYHLTAANSVNQALIEIESQPGFHLIMSDLVMRERNGKEFYLEVCRRWPELEPRFVFFTGGAFDRNLREFQAKMGNRIVHKPLRADEVLAMVSGRLRHLYGEEP